MKIFSRTMMRNNKDDYIFKQLFIKCKKGGSPLR